MFNKILVCLDGSKFAERILPHVIDKAQRFESKLILLKVINVNFGEYTTLIPGHPPLITSEVMDSIIIGEEMKAKAYMNNLVARLNRIGINVDAVVQHKVPQGTIGSTIAACAKANEVDVIMIATHRRKGWKRLVFSSIAESVIRETTLPVLAIKPEDTLIRGNTSLGESEVIPSWRSNSRVGA